LSALLDTTRTRAPFATKASPVGRPIPLAPPVTTAWIPLRDFIIHASSFFNFVPGKSGSYCLRNFRILWDPWPIDSQSDAQKFLLSPENKSTNNAAVINGKKQVSMFEMTKLVSGHVKK